MNKNNDKESGDGLLFHNAQKISGMSTADIIAAMDISNGTLYRLFRKPEFTAKEKAAAASALGRSISDIFSNAEMQSAFTIASGNPSIRVEDLTNEINNKSSQNKDVDMNTSDAKDDINSISQLKNGDNLMINRILDIIDHANRNMEKIADANQSLARTIEHLSTHRGEEEVKRRRHG